MRKVKASYFCLAITILSIAAMLLIPGITRGSMATERTAKVETAEVALGTVERLLALSGRVRYETEYAALAPSSGLIAEVYVQPGQSVTAGQALFRMDGTAQEAAVAACLSQEKPEADLSAFPTEAAAAADTLLTVASSTEETLRASRLALETLTVRAQVDGLVQQVSVSPHSGVTVGTPAMTLSGAKQRIVATAVQRDAEKLAPGQRARIISKGVQQCMATVTSVGAATTDLTTGQVSCEVTLSLDEGLNLPLGAPVEAEVELLRAECVPVIPLQAVTTDGGIWWISDERAWHAPITVLAQDEVSAWVALPEGVRVITDGGDGLLAGQKVKEMKP